jgi:hypothetical protein
MEKTPRTNREPSKLTKRFRQQLKPHNLERIGFRRAASTSDDEHGEHSLADFSLT